MSADPEHFAAQATNWFTSIEQTAESACERQQQITAIKQTLDSQLNALAQDLASMDSHLHSLYMSNSSGSRHLQPGFALTYRVKGRIDCKFALRIRIHHPDDMNVQVTCSDYRQKHRLSVYQGVLQVQAINRAVETSLLHWLELIHLSLTE